jgi:MiaB/RimO family radical SAM methylthiotransferase
VGGHAPTAHVPVDRRTLLPITPVERPGSDVHVPGHAWVPRMRLSSGPVGNLKLASGCDRRCAFCAIPSFRGAFVSRPPDDVVAEAAWLGTQGVRELMLVSENSTSYGKDLPGGTRALAHLLRRLTHVPGIDRVRVSYLQPAEMRPDLVEVIASTPGVAPYFDLSFQHASPSVLRRMRRFGSRADFLDLCARIRALAPEAGIRTNVIVGFPGETEDDLAELEAFLEGARLDAVGVFGYSDEDGTEAAGHAGKLAPEEIAARVERITALTQELMAQRAEDRVGTEVDVLIEAAEDVDFECTGRAAHQAPEVDGECVLARGSGLAVGDMVRAVVVGSDGADLHVDPRQKLPGSALGGSAGGVG